ASSSRPSWLTNCTGSSLPGRPIQSEFRRPGGNCAFLPHLAEWRAVGPRNVGMRHVAGVLVLVLSLGLAGVARGDFDQSRAWFEALPVDDRTETQANLTLLGYYTYLVDGQFGKGTYEALTAFQRSLGRAQTGVLIPRDRDVL